MNKPNRHTDDQLIESLLAARLAAGLTAASHALPHDVSERLRFSRQQALLRARQVQQPAMAAPGLVRSGNGAAALLGGPVAWWQRVASLVPLAMLVAGLVAIDHATVREQVLAAAEFDAQLLADDLPPAAYSDPGFAEFIRSDPAP